MILGSEYVKNIGSGQVVTVVLAAVIMLKIIKINISVIQVV